MNKASQVAAIALASFGLQQLGVGALTAPEAVCGDPAEFHGERVTDAQCEGIADGETCLSMKGFSWDEENAECALGFTIPGGADQAMLDACTANGGTVTGVATCQSQGDYFAGLLAQSDVTSLTRNTCNFAHAQIGTAAWFYFWGVPGKCCGDNKIPTNGGCSRGQMLCEADEDYQSDTISSGKCTNVNQTTCDALAFFSWEVPEVEEAAEDAVPVPAPDMGGEGQCNLLYPMTRTVASEECEGAGGFLQDEFSCGDMNALMTVMSNVGDVPWGTLNEDDESCDAFFAANLAGDMFSRASFQTWMGPLCCGGGTAVCSTIEDLCPTDPDKLEPGECGCGVPDVDTDDDGVVDCPPEESSSDEADCTMTPEEIAAYDGAFTEECAKEDMLSFEAACANVTLDAIGDLGCCMIPFVETLAGDDAPADFDAADALGELLTAVGIDADAAAMEGMGECDRSFGIANTAEETPDDGIVVGGDSGAVNARPLASISAAALVFAWAIINAAGVSS